MSDSVLAQNPASRGGNFDFGARSGRSSCAPPTGLRALCEVGLAVGPGNPGSGVVRNRKGVRRVRACDLGCP